MIRDTENICLVNICLVLQVITRKTHLKGCTRNHNPYTKSQQDKIYQFSRITLLISPSSITELLILLNSSNNASTSLTLTAKAEKQEKGRTNK